MSWEVQSDWLSVGYHGYTLVQGSIIHNLTPRDTSPQALSACNRYYILAESMHVVKMLLSVINVQGIYHRTHSSPPSLSILSPFYYSTIMASLVSALPPGSRTLVTGENGYIASHVVDKLLQQGHLARGTIRAPKPWLDEYFAQKYSPNAFESVTVSSFFEDVDIVGRVLDGGEGVVHLVWLSLIDYLEGIEADHGLNKGI